MKKIVATLLFTSLMLLGSKAFAQIVPGGGYLFASEQSVSGDDKSEADAFHGFYVGASYRIPLVGGLGIAPGLYADMLFYQKAAAAGNSGLGINAQGKYRELAVNVPVNLTYSYAISDDIAVMAFAGPVFQYGIISKATVSGTVSGSVFGIKYSYTDGTEIDAYDAEKGHRNRFNVFLGGGVGLQVGDILFTLGYDHTLLDIDRYDNVKTHRNQIKAGINIGF